MFPDYENFLLAAVFNEVSGREIHNKPNPNFKKGLLSQYQILVSEFNEFDAAWNAINRDHIECLDGLVDMNYILYGTLKHMGITPNDYDTDNVQVNLTNDIHEEIKSLRNLFGIYQLIAENQLPDDTFDNVKILLMGINLRVLNIARLLDYDYNRAFKIVHEANMSKFCETEDQAIQTVEYYRTSNYKDEYRFPDYRLSPDGNYYIVYNNDKSDQPLNAGKILKYIHWREPDLRPLFASSAYWLNSNSGSQSEPSETRSVEPGITLIIGPMFSDKTNRLFLEYDKHMLQKYKCLIIKYAKDNRFGSDEKILITHDSKRRPAIASESLLNIESYSEYDVLFIDEIQFFELDLDKLVQFSRTKKIFIAGLSGDFMRKPFENVSNLIPLASKIITCRAICLKNGKKAAFTKRLINSGERIIIGDNDIYSAVDLENFYE